MSDSASIRDSVRDLLGTDLSFHQLPSFLSHLDQISRHFQDNGVPVTEDAFTLFIVQTISVLRLVFDRSGSDSQLAEEAATTLCELLGSFASYLSRLESDEEGYMRKISLCELCQLVFAVPGRHQPAESSLRNRILGQLVAWASVEDVSAGFLRSAFIADVVGAAGLSGRVSGSSARSQRCLPESYRAVTRWSCCTLYRPQQQQQQDYRRETWV